MYGIRVDKAGCVGLCSVPSLWSRFDCSVFGRLLRQCPTLFEFLTEGEVYSWGKGARGRLGRRDEDAGLPKPVQLDETHPYVVTSLSCCHGNTLLAVRCESCPISPPPCMTWVGGLTQLSSTPYSILSNYNSNFPEQSSAPRKVKAEPGGLGKGCVKHQVSSLGEQELPRLLSRLHLNYFF